MKNYISSHSWRKTAQQIADRGAGGPVGLIVPWWTSFWAVPIRTLFRRLARSSPRTRRVLLCHNLKDHASGVLKRFLTLGVFSVADALSSTRRRTKGAEVSVLRLTVNG